MARSLPPQRRGSPAAQFRGQIETAEATGLSRPKMTLKLTPGDASLLKRDRALDVSDISFVDGVMRYLGVRVEEGGVTTSELVTSG